MPDIQPATREAFPQWQKLPDGIWQSFRFYIADPDNFPTWLGKQGSDAATEMILHTKQYLEAGADEDVPTEVVQYSLYVHRQFRNMRTKGATKKKAASPAAAEKKQKQAAAASALAAILNKKA